MTRKLQLATLLGALLVVLSAFGGASVAAQENQGTLVVGTDAAFPPFEQLNETTNEFEGYDIDVAEAIANETNRTLQVQNLKFDALIPALQQGRIDLILSAMTITDEREEVVDFSEPYFSANQSVMVRNGSDIQAFDDLEGQRIGVQRGTTGDFFVTEEFPQAQVTRFDTFPAAGQALLQDRVDAVVMDLPAVVDFVNQNEPELTVAFDIFTGEQYGAAVQEGNTELLAQVNATIERLNETGQLADLKEKWGIAALPGVPTFNQTGERIAEANVSAEGELPAVNLSNGTNATANASH